MTICLGIESSAHTFGAAIVDSDCKILANERHTHTTQSGGLIPRELAEHHAAHALPGSTLRSMRSRYMALVGYSVLK
jgi:tRNA A37 threonylcarbamoyltransferase TsaD